MRVELSTSACFPWRTCVCCTLTFLAGTQHQPSRHFTPHSCMRLHFVCMLVDNHTAAQLHVHATDRMQTLHCLRGGKLHLETVTLHDQPHYNQQHIQCTQSMLKISLQLQTRTHATKHEINSTHRHTRWGV